jgi:hypothetical protein
LLTVAMAAEYSILNLGGGLLPGVGFESGGELVGG